MPPENIGLRLATRDDIPAIVALVLTSYRRFPLFDFLYEPLRRNINNANDTLYFWKRRTKKSLLDHSSQLVVAEIDVPTSWQEPTKSQDPMDEESWRMLRWLQAKRKIATSSASKSVVVGFALWRFEGEDSPSPRKSLSLLGKIEELIIDIQLWFRRRFYPRKDVDQQRYAAYLASEETLKQKFHQGSFLYLDVLCVDFRCHRSGVGRRLIHAGQEIALAHNLSIRTETTENNVSFYEKLGFSRKGDWEVQAPNGLMPMILSLLEWTHLANL